MLNLYYPKKASRQVLCLPMPIFCNLLGQLLVLKFNKGIGMTSLPTEVRTKLMIGHLNRIHLRTPHQVGLVAPFKRIRMIRFT